MSSAIVRAKFMVTGVKRFTWTEGAEVTMGAQYDEQLPEDLKFSEATPTGELTMLVTSQSALERLAPDGKPGRVFYLDFVPAD